MPALLLYYIQPTAYQYGDSQNTQIFRRFKKQCAFACHLIYSEGERRVADGG